MRIQTHPTPPIRILSNANENYTSLSTSIRDVVPADSIGFLEQNILRSKFTTESVGKNPAC